MTVLLRYALWLRGKIKAAAIAARHSKIWFGAARGGNRGRGTGVHRAKTKTNKERLRAMALRWRFWTLLKLAFRKRPVPQPQLPYDLDEFAKLLSSRDPRALKQLASGLAARGAVEPHKLPSPR